jgi:hypothetical protein
MAKQNAISLCRSVGLLCLAIDNKTAVLLGKKDPMQAVFLKREENQN